MIFRKITRQGARLSLASVLASLFLSTPFALASSFENLSEVVGFEQPDRHINVVGGDYVRRSHPFWQTTVSLDIDGQTCTGTLIAEDIVLTAAHCLDEKPRRIEIRFYRGVFYADRRMGRTYYLHKDFEPDAPFEKDKGNDIAVIRFEGRLPYGFNAAPILDDFDHLQSGSEIYAVGFGRTHPSRSTYYGSMNFTRLQVFEIASDKRVYADDPQRRSSVCFGDSGGPAYIVIDGVLYVWGVSSGGFKTCDGESYFENIDGHRDWLEDAIRRMRQQAQGN